MRYRETEHKKTVMIFNTNHNLDADVFGKIESTDTELHENKTEILCDSLKHRDLIVKKFEEKGILKSEKKFNHLLFKANTQNKKFKQFKLNYNLNLLHDSGLINHLIKEFNHPEAIILFGSFAKAENISSSDIDLLIVSSVKKEINLRKFEKQLCVFKIIKRSVI